MVSMNDTPSANRIHIGVFGKTNSGKSTFINSFTGQQVSIVSELPGTTTDPVTKAMEIHPLGACVLVDTAGFDDTTLLGSARIEKTKAVAEKTDLAVVLISGKGLTEGENIQEEMKWVSFFRKKNIPVLVLINENDKVCYNRDLEKEISLQFKVLTLSVNVLSREDMSRVKEQLARLLPEELTEQDITGDLVSGDDVVLLVMPQDIQAPKGRLILPQVQTIRELLDKKCMVMSVTADQLEHGLQALKNPPKLIITDSQIFDFVYSHTPKESMLTSFSVLFAAYKGDITYYMEGAKAIDALTENSRVLIAECCTHAPSSEDIGRVKIPALLRKRVGEKLRVDVVSGTDYPVDLSDYDLIIQCGACMFNRRYVLSRIDRAKEQKVPMTNYGITIAHLTGILDKIMIECKRR